VYVVYVYVAYGVLQPVNMLAMRVVRCVSARSVRCTAPVNMLAVRVVRRRLCMLRMVYCTCEHAHRQNYNQRVAFLNRQICQRNSSYPRKSGR
jgi:hypothetical protein